MALRTFPQIFGWLWRSGRGYRLQAVLNMGIGLLGVAADLTFVWATKLAIDIATGVVRTTPLDAAILLLLGVVLVQLSLGVATRYVRASLGVRARTQMQIGLFARLLDSRWTDLRRYHTGHLVNRIQQDVRDEVSFLTESLPAFVTTVVQFVGAFIFLFVMDRTLACILVLVIPVFLVCSKLYMRRMRSLTHDIRDTESRMQATVQEGLGHVIVIKTLRAVARVTSGLRTQADGLRTQILHRTRLSVISSTMMNAGFAAGYLLTFVWGVKNLEMGIITYGMLIAFVQLVGQIQGPVRQLTRFVPVFIGAFTAGERLMELEQIEEEQPCADPFSPPSTETGVRFSHITYAYAPDARNIFVDFSYDFPPGSVTAVTGETGAGKTTLIRLLLSLLTPMSGSIYLYSANYSVPVTPSSRMAFAYVPQGNTLLSGTIRDNLRLACPEADDARLHEVLHTAAADFVLALPDGLDTLCGEQGGGLSEGQAQRIAIARALLLDAPILLFDEATSSLDAATERTVIERITRHRAGRTLIFITHRPEVLKYCTQTLHLERSTMADKSSGEAIY